MGYTGKATSRGVSATLNIAGTVVQAYVVSISENDEAQVDELTGANAVVLTNAIAHPEWVLNTNMVGQ